MGINYIDYTDKLRIKGCHYKINKIIKVDRRLLGILGLWVAEGWYTEIQNNDRILLGKASKWIKDVFGADTRIYNETNLRFRNKGIEIFFEKVLGINLKSKAVGKMVPNLLWSLPLNKVAEFLKMYFEGDGCCEDREITCSTKSKRLAYEIQTLLLRYNILSQIKLKRKKWNNRRRNFYELRISDKNSIIRFSDHIGFFSSDKKKKLHLLIKEISRTKYNTNIDLIPEIGILLEETRKILRLGIYESSKLLGKKYDYIYKYEINKRYPSRKNLLKFINLLENRLNDFMKIKDQIEEIKKLNIGLNNLDLFELQKEIDFFIESQRKADIAKEGNIPLGSISHLRKKLSILSQKNIFKIAEYANLIGYNLNPLSFLTETNNKHILKSIVNVMNVTKTSAYEILGSHHERLIKSIKKGKFVSLLSMKKCIEYFSKRFNNFDKGMEKCKLNIKYLKNLANSDILWDKIISIKKTKSKSKYVYDISIDNSKAGEFDNFISNNVILHNSTVCRKILDIVKYDKPIVIRHPMVYSRDLKKQIVQRFASFKDLIKYDTTYEEQEEYNPYLEKGFTVFAGIDYKKILEQAEKEGKLIIFESGNNDISLFKPDLYITIADPTRPEGIYSYPGEVNIRLADFIIINKINIVSKKTVNELEKKIKEINTKALIIKARSILKVDKPELIRNKNVVLIDDAPTITHGGLKKSVASYAAKRFRAKKIIDPRKYATGSMRKIFNEYPYLRSIPTMGYSKKQKEDFIKTVNNVRCDSIVFGSYAYLGDMKFNKPIARVTYELEEISKPDLKEIIAKFLKKKVKT